MTTITKLTKEQLIEEVKRMIAVAERYPDLDMARIEMEIFKIALASLTAEPVAWECGENIILFNPDTVEAYAKRAEISPKPLYAATPVQETGVYKDVLNIISLLENNEWAEHCTSTVLGSLLESEITRLVSKEQPAPVVPDEITRAPDVDVFDPGFMAGWNACCAAMLQAGNHTEQHLEMVDHSGDANEKGKDGTFIDEGTKQAGNSPVIPEGSFSGLVNSARALLDVLYEFGADEVAISEYVTNLEDALRVAAAPQQ